MSEKTNEIRITKEEETPLVKSLLAKLQQCFDALDECTQTIEKLKLENQQLKDELARFKRYSKKPKISPSKDRRPKDKKSKNKKRPGSAKRAKKASLEIHEQRVLSPVDVPAGSQIKRRRSYVVQDLVLEQKNIEFLLEEWITPDGSSISACLPAEFSHGHFSNKAIKFILYQHYHCQVTHGLLLEQLRELGLDISAGKLNEILSENNQIFHNEKQEVLKAGLEVSTWIQTDDTGARHNGKNGYCNSIGNDLFAVFHSTDSKSRVNFLQLLSDAFSGGFQLNHSAFAYMDKEGLPKFSYEKLEASIRRKFVNSAEWEQWLTKLQILNKRHRKIATEAALFGGAIAGGLNPRLIILSDDAGQFNIPLMIHALCWIHEERHIAKLVPINDKARQEQSEVTDKFWKLYQKLLDYRLNPSPAFSKKIKKEFHKLVKTKNSFASLNIVLQRMAAKEEELFVLLTHPEVPAHNNGSEGDVRDYVKRRKVSGGTRSTSGRECRDTFTSLKKTCRKLAVSFWDFLGSRIDGDSVIPRLASIIRNKAASNRKLLAFPLNEVTV